MLEQAKALFEVASAFLRCLALALLIVGLIWGLIYYREEIRKMISGITEISYGTTKVSIAQRIEEIKRSQRSGIEVNDEDVKKALERADSRASALRNTRVLWVNDDPREDRVIRDILEDYGVRNDVVRHSRDALSRLEETRYDIIVSDLGRPEGDDAGKILARHLVYCRPDLRAPFILYTASASSVPPEGVVLQTDHPGALIHQIVDLALVQVDRIRSGAERAASPTGNQGEPGACEEWTASARGSQPQVGITAGSENRP